MQVKNLEPQVLFVAQAVGAALDHPDLAFGRDCGLEQARRSAMAHRVRRIAPMGARVLIIGIWYYIQLGIADSTPPKRLSLQPFFEPSHQDGREL